MSRLQVTSSHGSPTRGVVGVLDRAVANPLMRAQLRAGLAPSAFAPLETTGRRTGARRCTPVGNGLIDDVFWLVAVLGTDAQYVRNLVADPQVRVKIRRTWHDGRASVLADDDPMARLDEIARHFGLLRRLDARILRKLAARSGSRPLTVRIDLA